jgi:UDP-N-acetylglucosamine 2-epimerase (non-hydrolysing)
MLLISYGTRPEYIKVLSLIQNIKNIKTLFTGQHATMINNHFPDYSIEIDEHCGNRLNDIVISILKHPEIFEGINYVLVQGDTTSSMAVALSAFQCNIQVIHLEAGLRTYDLHDPYPEEMNRQLISRIASIHLCPTNNNKDNIEHEYDAYDPSNIDGIIHGMFPQYDVYVCGNTGLDNIDKTDITYENYIIITLHRRDNIPIMSDWFSKIKELVLLYPNIHFIFPMHPNPEIRKHNHILCNEQLNNLHIIEPVSHEEMNTLIKKCKLIISDSGGLQEEASYLHKCIIVCRKTTERPETIDKTSFMCYTPDTLISISQFVLEHLDDYKNFECPYGDGNAWVKVKEILEEKNII